MEFIIIVGGGVSGASAAFHILHTDNFKGKILLLEAGTIGKGVMKQIKFNTNDIEKQFTNETTMSPWHSGSHTLDDPNRIKMIITITPCIAEEFVRHNGKRGLAMYNTICSTGRDIQIELANSLMNDGKSYNNLSQNHEIPHNAGCTQLGSYTVCYKDQVEDFKIEYSLLKEAGFEVEWYGKKEMDEIHGEKAGFYAGIFFPKDGVIDSAGYSRILLDYCIKKFPGQLEYRENTHVIKYEEKGLNKVHVYIDKGEMLVCNSLIVSTGGLFNNDTNLVGILIPCYSYITAIPNNKSDNKNDVVSHFKNSPNFQTFGFTHDWCITQGKLRISGEDHYHALKPPRKDYRCKNMQDWASNKYPHFLKVPNSEIKFANGVYSETKDYLPLVGKISNESPIIYFLGCNAFGQALMSGIAPMLPGVLGLKKLNKQEEELLDFIDIKRFNVSERKYLKIKPKF